MNRNTLLRRRTIASVAAAALLGVALLLGGCSSPPSGSSVPSLTGGSAPRSDAPGSSAAPSAVPRPSIGYSASRVSQLHAAAQCLREHGVPAYQDPVLTPDGQVYTDARSIQDAEAKMSSAQRDAATAAFEQACGHLFAVAGLQPDSESIAPPKLVQAGVVAARCLRAHGLPNYRDPTGETPFTPGHGFGISGDELPNNGAGGKQDPTVQRALTACRSQLNAEIAASTLSSLAHD